MITIWARSRTTVNDGPHRRCYNGAFIKAHEEWSEWMLVTPSPSMRDARESVTTFRSINPRDQYEIRDAPNQGDAT